MMRSTSLALCLLASTQALAQQAPALRAEAIVTGETVRYGDLVETKGEDAAIPLFRAPSLGGVGSIKAERIAAAARELGLTAPDSGVLQAVIVRRPARTLSQAEIEGVIRTALHDRVADSAGAEVTLEPMAAPVRIAATGPVPPANIVTYDARSGRFSARLTGSETMLTGLLGVNVLVPMLTRAVGKGDVIGAHDLAMTPVPRRNLPVGAVQEAPMLVGSIARRGLSAGQPLREGDVMKPELVEKNQTVTVLYEVPGMNLALRGKALSGGTMGAPVAILNPASKRTIEGIVTGTGQVTARINPTAAQKQ